MITAFLRVNERITRIVRFKFPPCPLFINYQGWNGLLLDGHFENAAINLHREIVSSANIVSLMVGVGGVVRRV